MIKKMFDELKRVLSDDRGAEGLEKILLIGALILPLLGILIYFRAEITEWMRGIWGEVQRDNDTYEYTP